MTSGAQAGGNPDLPPPQAPLTLQAVVLSQGCRVSPQGVSGGPSQTQKYAEAEFVTVKVPDGHSIQASVASHTLGDTRRYAKSMQPSSGAGGQHVCPASQGMHQ